MGVLITILTPTYNRSKLLIKLYNSLIKQTSHSFKWLIVDDGSTDNTKNVIENFKQDKFKIDYIYKTNGGKHTALNLGFDYIDTELTFIVDSDDILTKDAIQTIINDWENLKNENICGLSYLRGYDEEKVIGKKFRDNRFLSNFIDERFNKNCQGDKAEVWRSDLLKKNKFPIFKNEKFLSESVVWVNISYKYDMYFINKIIYITEYLENGLTKSGRKLRINCPKGGRFSSNMIIDKRFSMRQQVKACLLYIIYSKFDGVKFSKCIKECNNRNLAILLYIFGCFIYYYWKRRYL